MPDPTLTDVADKVDDLTRLVTRHGVTLGTLADARGVAAGPDLPLLVDLLALLGDAQRCAATARSRRERAAFAAIGAGLERLLTGRGGVLVTPRPGDPFSGATMEAAEIVATDDEARDRTVAEALGTGLQVAGRSARPARVAVYRHRPGQSTSAMTSSDTSKLA